MIAQHRSGNAGNLWLRRWTIDSRRMLVRAQSDEGGARQLRVTLGHFAHQFEEQRQRTRCSLRDAFMLRCTMLR